MATPTEQLLLKLQQTNERMEAFLKVIAQRATQGRGAAASPGGAGASEKRRAESNKAIRSFAGGAVSGSFSGVIDSFKSITAVASKFVDALNPAAALVLGQAFRDLRATIGTALEPVITLATGVVRQFAASLAPVMQALRPVVEQLSKTFAQVANVFAGAFAGILQSLMPAFKAFADVVTALVPVFQAFYATIAGLVEAVAGLFRGGDWQSVASSLKDTFRELAAATLRATVHVLRFVDALAGTRLAVDFVTGARRALRPEANRGDPAKAVPLNAGVGGLSDFGRQVTTAALLAGPAGGLQTKDAEEAAWRKGVLKSLVTIAASHESQFAKMIEAGFTRIEKELQSIVSNTVRELYQAPVKTALDLLPPTSGVGIARKIFGF